MEIKTRDLVVTALLSAVAFLLQYIEVPFPTLIPGFVKMDISDLPEILGAFSIGPVYGAIIAVLKNLLHGFIKGTSTGWTGEICNAMLGAAFAFSAGLIYKFKKTRKVAIISCLVGSVIMGLVSLPVNYFISYPLYASLFGGMDNIIAAYKAILPSSDTLLKCLVIFNIPFTIVKGLICSVICILIYKPLSPILHGKSK